MDIDSIENTDPAAESIEQSPVKTHPVTKGVKRRRGVAPVYCGCDVVISSEVKALQCDRCGSADAWKCIECLHITETVYDSLVGGSGSELKWFCDKCEIAAMKKSSASSDSRLEGKVDTMMILLEKLVDKSNSIEKRLEEKADRCSVAELQDRIAK